ncbi:Uncharacterised protein [uncultured archaeon]|nr:Uncharacterised protein [uncultured archaeon]
MLTQSVTSSASSWERPMRRSSASTSEPLRRLGLSVAAVSANLAICSCLKPLMLTGLPSANPMNITWSLVG